MNTAFLGCAQANITPAAPVQTIGFGRADEWSRGVLSPLEAQAAVWEMDGEACCLVTVDHIGFSSAHALALREEIGRAVGSGPDRVMLCFSHTHSAPNDSIETDWYASVREKLIAAVREASARKAPVLAAWGNAQADIGVNRRAENQALDRRVGILKVTGAGGELKLLVLRVTAHCNVLKADNYRLSPDFFGAVRDMLQERYGCPVMVTQGASGNVAPRFFLSETTPVDAADPLRFVRSETALRDMAAEVLRAVEGVLDALVPGPVDKMGMYSAFQTLEADVPSLERALSISEEARREAGIDGVAWLSEVRRLIVAGVQTQTERVEIQYFFINGGCLCGVPNEIMCEFALRASEALRCDTFYLGGYTNGCTGYFPTEEEYDKGGYEVYWSMLIYYIYHGRVASLNRDSASELIREAVRNAPEPIRRCEMP